MAGLGFAAMSGVFQIVVVGRQKYVFHKMIREEISRFIEVVSIVSP